MDHFALQWSAEKESVQTIYYIVAASPRQQLMPQQKCSSKLGGSRVYPEQIGSQQPQIELRTNC